MDTEFRKVSVENMPSVDAHISGGRLLILSVAATLSTVALFAIADGISVGNQLKQQELKIREKQLELEQRRHALDSVMYYRGMKIKQK